LLLLLSNLRHPAGQEQLPQHSKSGFWLGKKHSFLLMLPIRHNRPCFKRPNSDLAQSNKILIDGAGGLPANIRVVLRQLVATFQPESGCFSPSSMRGHAQTSVQWPACRKSAGERIGNFRL
jgi:hypothetical protein